MNDPQKSGPNEMTELVQAAEKSARAEALVAESGRELAAVNTLLHEEMKENSGPKVSEALAQSRIVEDKVNEASLHLSTVTNVLSSELTGRSDLELQLADSKADGRVAQLAALHDVLTGLPNRALLLDRLEHGVAQASRHDWILAVMFIDLNKFKRINDTYGHEAGDQVLRTIGHRLSEGTRDEDTISRYGGDEFLFLLSEVKNASDLPKIAENILRIIERPSDLAAYGATTPVSVGASLGIAIFPQDASDPMGLIRRADAAMYSAKKKGGGFSFSQ
jgi:diguanylate cyclase (GGDEF)-like protein